jgi:spermidine synthase
MGLAKDGWYTELGAMWPGMGLSLKVKEVLHTSRSKFQDVCVFESDSVFGTVLLLDGVIQCTDADEFSYQEMLAHVAVGSLDSPPKRALVVGGGDGGVLRELARYGSLEKIEMAEIDAAVPEISKQYFPQMAVGFSDPRAEVHITDGVAFVEAAQEGTYDVIVVDSSDPVGPAEVLFQRPFFEALHRALRPGGVVVTQAESLWLHLDVIESLARMCSEVFGAGGGGAAAAAAGAGTAGGAGAGGAAAAAGGSVGYAYTTIPTYPSGQIGMMVCHKARVGGAPPLDPREPRQPQPPAGGAATEAPSSAAPPLALPALQYYTREVHRASFVLPRFAAERLGPHLTFQK